MKQDRKNKPEPDGPGRPLSARSVIASMLLGTEGLSLPVRALVRAGELFGIAEGTTRVALSRMVATGELVAGPGAGRYTLAGGLVERSAAQETGRRPRLQAWTGQWQMAVVTSSQPRPAGDRAALRAALRRLDLAELREGVWLRPDNLGDPVRLPAAAQVVSEQCDWLTCRWADGEDGALAARLWNLDGWARSAEALHRDMKASIGRLRGGQASALRPGFLLAAATLRHLAADPLLPDELLPARWPGRALRDGYDGFEAALQSGLRRWFRESS